MSSLIQAENITKSYGDLVLYENISFSIHENQKVALIARNGAGKSTILNILTNKDTPDSGKITFKNDINIGFLEQNPKVNPQNTVIEEVFNSDNKIVKLIKEYEKALENNETNIISQLSNEMDRYNAWDYEVKIKQILSKLDIKKFSQKVSELSGGQKRRIALARILINEPNLLILDEPTNHLNLEMIEWLENFLNSSKVTLLMVTHDRYFLDRVCNKIIEIDDKQIYTYNGNYSYFLEKRYERIQNRNAELEKAKNLLRKEQDWINRTPMARTSKAKYRIDAFYELKEKASGKIQDQNIRLDIAVTRLGKKILNIKHIHKSFDDIQILKDFSYNFNKGEKVGIIGKNGTGKTTFLNIITNEIKPDKGYIDFGETVVVGYYKQEGIKFKPNQKVIDYIKEFAEVIKLKNGNTVSASQFLQYFLFTPQMQYSKIEKLSGGEKRRLYLMSILIKNPNFLILDEPTNDLDIMTLHVLEDYLQNFEGSVIIVSHDRYFMDNIVDHLFVFNGNADIKDFAGNYSQYRNEYLKNLKRNNISDTKKTAKSKQQTKEKKKFSFKEKYEFEQLEKELDELNNRKTKIETLISSNKLSQTELIENSEELGKLLELINEKELRWLELSELKDGE